MFKSYLRAFEIKNQKCQGGLASNICYWIESTTIHWARTTHTQTLFIWHVIHSWAKIIIRLHKTFHEIMHHNLTKKSLKFQSFTDYEFSKNCTGIKDLSMARANLKNSKYFSTSTTTASKYIPKRPRICINWNHSFQTSLHKIFKNYFLLSKFHI